nr:DNA cytosine methyltransferase [Pseudomonas viridiflava]
MSAQLKYLPLKYGSVCSGIEAATVAWHPLGMEPVWFAEIERFPSAVLAHHYPNTPNLGDMTKLATLALSGKIAAPDVLVGGTPCQAFSVAGMRQGMLDPRGALTIKYVELADAVDHVRTRRNEPESIIVWENVPGVLSDKGNAFGCFLGALAGENCELQPPGKRWHDAGCVYGPKRTIAWRILDAQYFGLAQRRRRVFVVASARAGFDPLEVLFEREGTRRDSPPRREKELSLHPTLTARGGGSLDDREAYVLEHEGIRRTTPLEWERCQGFPDNYTRLPWKNLPIEKCPDSLRYRSIGNSKSVPVVTWIGQRLILKISQMQDSFPI